MLVSSEGETIARAVEHYRLEYVIFFIASSIAEELISDCRLMHKQGYSASCNYCHVLWSMQSQGGAVEALVQLKMQQKEFIILCLEDSSDWSNATTRRVVMQVLNKFY